MRRHINETSRKLVEAKAELRRKLPNFNAEYELLVEAVSLRPEDGVGRPPSGNLPARYVLAHPTLRILYTFDDEWVVILNVDAIAKPPV